MTDKRRGLPIKRREDGGEFDLSTWSFDAQDSEELRAFIGKAVTEAVKLAAGENVFADFALGRCFDFDKWPKDLTTIHVQLPFGAEEYEGPEWTFTLTELVDWEIEMNEGSNGITPDAVPALAALRDALRGLAERIDGALPRGAP